MSSLSSSCHVYSSFYLSSHNMFRSQFLCKMRPIQFNFLRFNLSKWPTWRTIPLFYNAFITVLYMFRAPSCSSSGSQIILIRSLVWSLSVSDRLVFRLRENSLYMFRATLCSSSGSQIVLTQHLVSSFSVSGRPVHHLQWVTVPDAVLIKFDSSWWARRCSKHVEDCNKPIIK